MHQDEIEGTKEGAIKQSDELMGGTHSVGRDNDELVDVLIQEKYIG